jgi:hypothetical protein
MTPAKNRPGRQHGTNPADRYPPGNGTDAQGRIEASIGFAIVNPPAYQWGERRAASPAVPKTHLHPAGTQGSPENNDTQRVRAVRTTLQYLAFQHRTVPDRASKALC